MKNSILFLAVFCFYTISYSQSVKSNPQENKKFDNNVNVKINEQAKKYDVNGNRLKVTLMKDSLFVTDKGQLVPVADIAALESIIKKLPQPETLTIEFESRDANPEKLRAIDAVLKQCRCHITRHAISFNNNLRL